MNDVDIFNNFIDKGIFNKETINELIDKLSINNKQLIRKSFKKLNYVIGNIENKEYFFQYIVKLTDLIYILCNNEDFNEEEVVVNRIRIKKARESILAYSNKFHSDTLLNCANKLDEIILDKNINVDDLIKLIKNLIDRKEDIKIIKKMLNTNKGAIIKENNVLFNYTFKKALLALEFNEPSIYYYIALLKIFYSSSIDKEKYIKDLNEISTETNEFANEIYYIIHGVKRSLNPDEILNKYGIVKNLEELQFYTPKEIFTTGRFLTIDSENTRVRDDAISIKLDGTNTIIGIHITDPGKFVIPNSNIDIQARNNYKNFNLTSRIFSYNTENIFSLNEGEVKPVISLYVILDVNGKIIDYKLKEETIKISDSFSFSSSDLIIDRKQNSELQKDLISLYNISKILESKNKKKKDYWSKKDKDSIEKNVVVHKSDKIISELMVLYNNIVATIACNNNFPYVYRTQGKSYLDNLINKLGIQTDDSLDKVIKSIYLVSKYSYIPLYHNGLNLAIYSHSTDPLRRYPDLYNEYLLHKFYFNDIDFNFDYDEYLELINYFNQRSTEISLMRSEYNRAVKLLKKS